MSPYIVSLVVCAGLLGLPGSAAAALLTVTSDADSGAGSLRAAVATALGQPGADEIVFAAALNGRTITLTGGGIAVGVQEVIVNASALPGGITLSGNNASRIFSVPEGGDLELDSLTLRNGRNSDDGGAVYNEGTLTAANCTFADCFAGDDGGAVRSYGACMATQCTFTGNAADSGGAIASNGPLVLTHCTLSGNTGSVSGGGVWTVAGVTLTGSIVAGNTAPAGADMFNSGTITRTGMNLVQAVQNSGGGTASGPAAISAAPRLQPLANYGGPVPTMPPRADSPALDRIATAPFPADQRGFPRVMWGAADLGAVEAGTQADGAWEVRHFYRTPAPPLHSLEDALALAADPAAAVIVATPAVVNHHDPDNFSGPGYFGRDEPAAVNNLTPQGAANGDDNDFATVARTFISIAEEGDYTFGFSGSEGARLRVFGAEFTSSTRLNAANPANPAHSGETLSFPGLTDNSATLGVCRLTPGVYPVEFVTWERSGPASWEVFAARGAQTSVSGAFRLAGDLSPGGPFTTGVLSPQQLPPVWTQEFEDGPGGFTVTNVNAPFDGPWMLDEDNSSWRTAGQGAEVASAPSTQLSSPPVTMSCQGDALLLFTHRFSFEEGNWDGGQVLLSVNDGPFTLVPPASFTLNGYTGTVVNNSASDIRGQPAFVFDSPGYVVPVFITTTARLGTFNAGDTLRVQFLASYDRDTSRGNPAWEIDTVSIEQQCAGANPGWELTVIRNGADSMSTALTQMFSHWAGVPQPNAVRSFVSAINLHDPQASGGGHGGTQSPYPGDGPADDDQFVAGARATLMVPAADDYTFCLLADDAARFRIRGSSGWTVSSAGPALTLVDGLQTASLEDVFGQVHLSAGAHEIELVQYEGTGAAHVCLWGARGRHREFDPEIFTLVGAPGMIRTGAPFALVRQPGLSRPANDDFAAAAAATAAAVVRTDGAGKESGEPGAASGTVWWRWTAAAGTWVLDTAGSDFDTRLAVYSGDSLALLSELAANDNYDGTVSARLTLTLTAPATLAVQAGGAAGAAGLLSLRIRQVPAPANDAFAAPLPLAALPSLSAAGDNDAATAEAGEPAHAAGIPARRSVWFTWTAPADGLYTVDTRGSRYDTVLAVYTGATLAGLNRIASNDDLSDTEKQSSVTFSAVAGAPYRIAVDGGDADARGDWRLNITHRAVVTAAALLNGPQANAPRTFRMTWQAEPWVTYRIERSADLAAWSTVVDALPSQGASHSLDIENLPPSLLRQYFRVRRE